MSTTSPVQVLALRATGPEPEADPGHLVDDAVWAEIVALATEREAFLERPRVGRGLINRTITAAGHGGVIVGGPRLGVVHSMETPLRPGYAYSIASMFARNAATSATVCIDPAESIRCLPDNVVAWHCGPRANGFTVGAEQAGYARFSVAEWTTADGLAQMRRLAEYMVDCWRAYGIPLRWATDDEIRAAARGGRPVGWCTHDDVRRVLGGTSHTDPMPNYPRAQLVALANQIANPTPAPTGDPAMVQFDLIRNSDTGSMVMAAPGGVWVPIPSPAYLTLYVARGRCPGVALNVPTNEFDHFRDYVYAHGAPARAQGVRHTAAGELPLTEAEVLELLAELGQPVLTVEQIIGAAPLPA